MTLQNLLKIGQLKTHPKNAAEIERLLAAAARNLIDADSNAISSETRFDAAYKAIMQVALAALMANSYRPDTNRPGHHITVVQGLVHTIGLSTARVNVLDTLRRMRNLSDYTGDDIDDSSAAHCRGEAMQLLRDVNAWLKQHHPEIKVMVIASKRP